MKKHIRLIFLASFLFSLHMALLAYVNSSMLAKYVSANVISLSYTISSILALIFVSFAPKIVRMIGNIKYVSLVLVLSSVLLFLISNHTGFSVIPFFILYFSLNSLVLYGLDIFLEHYSSESKTGNIRGAYLTLGNIGWVIAPLISSFIQTKLNFSAIYVVASFVVLLTLFVVIIGQRGFVDRLYKKSHFADGLHILRKNKSLRKITILNFLLQLYFVVMVIYSPVYLTSVIGFSWKTLGFILAVMLSAFVIFPYPAGKLADKFGEKGLMYSALVIMSIATIIFANLGQSSPILYASILFMTRIGASILETVCDSAFFKRVSDSDSSVISTYRMMMPVAYTVAPLIAGLVFALYSYKILFICIGVVMAFAIAIALGIKKPRKA